MTININNNRHLTNSYHYAHFSKINSWNYFLFPSILLLTKPQRFVLREGESLFIPKKWWHWIVTPTKTTAINFWFGAKIVGEVEDFPRLVTRIGKAEHFVKGTNENIIKTNEPAKVIDLYLPEQKQIIYDQIIRWIKEENKHFIWNSSKNFGKNGLLYSGESFLNEKKNHRYLLTLSGYGDNLNNENIKNKISDWIELPQILKDNSKPVVDTNLWVSSNYHDTGLHYDDNDGILYVLKGEKHITLYPPNDSKYLLPYDTTPNYAKEYPIFMKYNEYSIKNKSISGLPSQMILYQSLVCFAKYNNVLTTVQKIYDKKKDPSKKLVWGCKKQGGQYRWEIYNYHYDQHNNKKINKTDWTHIVLNNSISCKIVQIMNENKTIINSIDILNDINCLNKEHHTYEMKENMTEMITPFYGYGFDIISDEKQQVSTFIYDTYENFIKNNEKYCRELELHYNNKFKELLEKYHADNMCLWNKKGDYFIQWLGISIDDFIHFLQENHYGECFINHMIENKKKYELLSHEITIVYDRNTMRPFRSGFYGCL